MESQLKGRIMDSITLQTKSY